MMEDFDWEMARQKIASMGLIIVQDDIEQGVFVVRVPTPDEVRAHPLDNVYSDELDVEVEV